MQSAPTIMLLLLALLAIPSSALASLWPPCGVPIARSPALEDLPRIASDGTGGALVVFRYGVNQVNDISDIYAQRVLSNGSIAPGWPSDGVPVCVGLGSQHDATIVSDGENAFIAWKDYRDYWTDLHRADVYLQKLSASGAVAPGWPLNGVPVCTEVGEQRFPKLALDGEGGVFVVWQDHRREPDLSGRDVEVDIYALRLMADGTPAAGWPEGGRAICAVPGVSVFPVAVSDGVGGAFIAWSDWRDTAQDYRHYKVFATRIQSDGSLAPGWAEDGVGVCTAPGYQAPPKMVADGEGGVFLVWEDAREDTRTTPPWCANCSDIYAQRLTGTGEIATGWPLDGLAICTAGGPQREVRITPDGAGGAFLAWADLRGGGDAGTYLHHLTGDGVAAGWPVDGMRLSTVTSWDVAMVGDGTGGVWVAYGEYDLYVQHVLATGELAPGWTPDVPVCIDYTNLIRPAAVTDGTGGMIVAWEDGRMPGGAAENIYAHRVTQDFSTPARMSPVEAEVTAEGVRLVWHGSEPSSTRVERRSDAPAWIALGPPRRVAPDRLEYEDRAVPPGRYGYRLAYAGATGETFTPEEWVTVPAYVLALQGFAPNPVVGEPSVSFRLASADPAVLQVFDTSGRMVVSRELHAPRPGQHVLQLGGAWSPGFYWLRLEQAGRSVSARGLVLR